MTKQAVLLVSGDPFGSKPNLRALRQADSLVGAGWNVTFVAWDRTGRTGSQFYPCERVYFPISTSSIFDKGLGVRRAAKRLSEVVVDNRPDLIIAHDIETLWAGALARKKLPDASLFYDSHESWPDLIAEHSRIEALLASWLERHCVEQLDGVLVPSPSIAKRFKGLGLPTLVTYNAGRRNDLLPVADFARLSPTYNEIMRNQVFGVNEKKFVVGYIGAQEQLVKGDVGKVLFDAMDRLKDKVLLVVGVDYTDTTKLGLVRENVFVCPRMLMKDLIPFYASLDLGLVLLASRKNYMKSLPNKLFHYMAAGVPILASGYPDIVDVLYESEAGWHVGKEPLDAGWLADHIREKADWLQASALANAGRAGRKAFEDRYCWDVQEPKFLEFVGI